MKTKYKSESWSFTMNLDFILEFLDNCMYFRFNFALVFLNYQVIRLAFLSKLLNIH